MCMSLGLTIKIPTLIQKLKSADDEAEHFSDHFFSLENNSGVRYLYQSVLLPLLNDQSVDTRNLNMDSFDMEDIGTLFSFYLENFTHNSKEFSGLRHIYEKCSESPAKSMPICFL